MSQICHKLHLLFSGLSQFAFPFDANRIPRNGIYVLFEKGEFAHETDRIVRVGTHTGNNQLASRLKQHFIKKNKDRSIFRKNIGRAILKRDQDAFLAQWEIDLTTRNARQKYAGTIEMQKLQETEKRVSEYIQQNFHFIAFRVDDKPKRLYWESKIISTVSQCNECHSSQNWLGLHSPKTKIKTGGLWLVNELNKQPLSEIEYEALTITALNTA
ncbi:MAG: hypothetical protein ACREDS_02880 [Limisphaerales bacterium]